MRGIQQSKGGFNNSPTRIFLELGAVLAAIFLLIFIAVSSASWLSDRLVENAPVTWEKHLGQVSWDYLAPADKRCDNPQ